MKRFIFLILILLAGCKVLQKPDTKIDVSSSHPADTGPVSVSHVETDSTKPSTDIDTVAAVEPGKILEEGFAAIDSIVDSLNVELLDTLSALGLLKDSIPTSDSLRIDSLLSDSLKRPKSAFEAPVEYQAKDSIVWTAGNIAYMYGDGDVKYQNIGLKAEIIEMKMDSNLVYATYGTDSLGEEFGYPILTEGDQSIDSKSMRYNFKTRKGYANHSVTKQGEGYVTSALTKKVGDDVMNMQGGRYTTCDDEHPHFYLNMTKAKVRPGKDIVTGPVNLVIEDVPLPIGLPFAFFPFTDSYSSGIIMPSYGDEMSRGFYLRDGGYYFALSDYFDLAVLGEIYTKGSWGLSGRTSYKKRYKYNGNFEASYLVTKTGDKGLPDYSKSKDFKIRWSHSQDAKANPYRTFSASVNYSTSSHDRNHLSTLYTPDATNNNKGSSVSISQRFPNKPFSISATMNINQRSQDSSVSITLPDMTLTLSRIYPFKRKNAIGKERIYEKISMSYTGLLRNNISTKEDKLFHSNLVKDWQNAMQHTIPVSLTTTIFDYINISPAINYTERWYTHKIRREYDPAVRNTVPVDTTYGFYRVYNYNASISASTTLYGMFTPWKMFQKWVHKIRHRMDPSVSLGWNPDFGDPKYGYYETYLHTDATNQRILGQIAEYEGYYSPFEGQLFGVPGRGKSGSVTFSIDNNIEAKIASAQDSTGEKKISLIDKLAGTMSYNMAADSLNWSDLSVALRLKFSQRYTLNLNMVFDTYMYGYDESTNRVYKINKTRWAAGKGLGRLRSTGTSFSYTFNNDTFKKLFGGKDDGGKKGNKERSQRDDNMGMGPDDDYMDDPFNQDDRYGDRGGFDNDNDGERGSLLKRKKKSDGEYDDDGYYNATIPWSFTFNYNLSLGYDAFNPEKMEYKYKFVHALSFNGNLQPTKNWRINFNATYDVEKKKVAHMTCSISRSMHCWQMTASIIPVGPLKSYSFSISASASMLKDLKYDQSSSYRDGQTWY